MGEKRLIEIANAINNADSGLSVMLYVTNLESSDVYLLLKYISTSKYKDMNLLSALVCFSRDYLKSKGIYEAPKHNEFEEQLRTVYNKRQLNIFYYIFVIKKWEDSYEF